MQREYEQAGTPELRAASLIDSFSLAQLGGNKREEEVSNKQTTKTDRAAPLSQGAKGTDRTPWLGSPDPAQTYKSLQALS